jgi:cell division protein FtsI (penicillin-binding protein 3)
VATPDDVLSVNGHIEAGDRVVADAHDHAPIDLTVTGILVKSSNVGAIKVGLKVGPETLTDYVLRFGFGQTLAPDFKGETASIVWSAERLDPSALASVSMGYQVGVTPLQMATAVSSIANGGAETRSGSMIGSRGTPVPENETPLTRMSCC